DLLRLAPPDLRQRRVGVALDHLEGLARDGVLRGAVTDEEHLGRVVGKGPGPLRVPLLLAHLARQFARTAGRGTVRAVAAMAREVGENPTRSRHCDRRPT